MTEPTRGNMTIWVPKCTEFYEVYKSSGYFKKSQLLIFSTPFDPREVHFFIKESMINCIYSVRSQRDLHFGTHMS